MSRKTLGVYIGRFQPAHLGHQAIIRQAQEKFDQVLILVGSPYKPRSLRNPFTYDERYKMLRDSLDVENDNVIIKPLPDQTYRDELWIESVQRIVAHHSLNKMVVLIGHSKDNTSYYLNLFPDWAAENVAAVKDSKDQVINSTKIRTLMFNNHWRDIWQYMPRKVADFVERFSRTQEFHELKNEYENNWNYQKSWGDSPYPPMFVTTDAVVVCSGHVLLITRGDYPGKGNLALPGGFLNQDETLMAGMVRELKEETRLKMPARAIAGCVVNRHVFDDPHRSSRGRTITHAFYVHLAPGKLPEVRGGDDAAHAQWYPLVDVKPELMHEDHYHILRYFTG